MTELQTNSFKLNVENTKCCKPVIVTYLGIRWELKPIIELIENGIFFRISLRVKCMEKNLNNDVMMIVNMINSINGKLHGRTNCVQFYFGDIRNSYVYYDVFRFYSNFDHTNNTWPKNLEVGVNFCGQHVDKCPLIFNEYVVWSDPADINLKIDEMYLLVDSNILKEKCAFLWKMVMANLSGNVFYVDEDIDPYSFCLALGQIYHQWEPVYQSNKKYWDAVYRYDLKVTTKLTPDFRSLISQAGVCSQISTARNASTLGDIRKLGEYTSISMKFESLQSLMHRNTYLSKVWLDTCTNIEWLFFLFKTTINDTEYLQFSMIANNPSKLPFCHSFSFSIHVNVWQNEDNFLNLPSFVLKRVLTDKQTSVSAPMFMKWNDVAHGGNIEDKSIDINVKFESTQYPTDFRPDDMPDYIYAYPGKTDIDFLIVETVNGIEKFSFVEANKQLLASASPYFANLFYGRHSDLRVRYLEIRGVKFMDFISILDVIYHRSCHIPEDRMYSLMQAIMRFDVPKARCLVERCLIASYQKIFSRQQIYTFGVAFKMKTLMTRFAPDADMRR